MGNRGESAIGSVTSSCYPEPLARSPLLGGFRFLAEDWNLLTLPLGFLGLVQVVLQLLPLLVRNLGYRVAEIRLNLFFGIAQFLESVE